MLVEMTNQMDEDMAVRFVEAILGITNPDEIKETISRSSTVYNHPSRLLNFNYLKNFVEYGYEDTVSRFFKTQEEAERFAKGELYCWSGEAEMSEEFRYGATHTFDKKSVCGLDTWMDGAKNDD